MNNNFIVNYLEENYSRVSAFDFYSSVFKHTLESKGCNETHKYHALANELVKLGDGSYRSLRHPVYDGMEVISELQNCNNFVIISPISYIGLSRKSLAARYIYAIAIDYDGIDTPQMLNDFWYQVHNKLLPTPTYVVFSGNNLHLYFLLDTEVACYDYLVKELRKLKTALIKRIWNKYTTSLYDKPQVQSLFQGFRMVGTYGKDGHTPVTAYLTGNVVSINYLNNFVPPKSRALIDEITNKKTPLLEAKEMWPEWYEKRIVKGLPKGTWQNNHALYDWWKNEKIKWEAQVGHRYYCIMCLAIYAKKCGITYEELEKDAYTFVPIFDLLTTNENNHFSEQDVASALEMFLDSYITFPIDSIVSLTNIQIEKNKRNYRTQDVHLKMCRMNRNILVQEKLINGGGRKSKKDVIENWKQSNPNGTVIDCINDTGLSKSTCYKYWRQKQTNY